MGDSLYIYNPGKLGRKDNTLQFVTDNGDKRDLQYIFLITIIFILEVFIQENSYYLEIY